MKAALRLCVVLASLAIGSVVGQTPTYLYSASDAQWAQIGSTGAYTMSTTAESYRNELWERPIEDGKVSISGTTMTTTG